MRLRFGVGLPTCREGVAYPVGYARPSDFVRIAQDAERLGFDSLWANDHLTTPHILRATLDRPPSFYEPLITCAAVSSSPPSRVSSHSRSMSTPMERRASIESHVLATAGSPRRPRPRRSCLP